MPTRPSRDPLTPGRIASVKEILRLGLTTLTTKHREILDEDDKAPAERQALLALQQVQRSDQATAEDGVRLLDLVAAGIVNAFVANRGAALAGFFAGTGWWRGVPLPSASREAKKFPLALRRLTAFLGLVDGGAQVPTVAAIPSRLSRC